MLEVELKFRLLDDFAAVEATLLNLGARKIDTRDESDHYFNAPDRDFAQTDEALRLRRSNGRNLITYKGPKLDAQTKTRTEIEIPFASAGTWHVEMEALLCHLGYRPVALVHKMRDVFSLKIDGFESEICLDDVQDVGRFIELETQAEAEQMNAAREAMLHLADRLKLAGSERRSYLEMLLESRENKA